MYSTWKGKILVGFLVFMLAVSLMSCAKEQKKPSIQGRARNEASYCYTGDEGGSITKINVDTNKVAKTISLDGTVHSVQVSPDGKILGATFIPDEDIDHLGEPVRGFAMFFSTRNDRMLKKIAVGKHPAHIDFTPDGSYALVTNSADNTVSLIEMATFKVIKTIQVGKGPHGIRLDRQGKFAYVANMGEDSVSEVDVRKRTQVKKIRVGKAPVTVGLTADKKWLAVTVNGEDALMLVPLTTVKTVTESVYSRADKAIRIKVDKGPAQLFVSPDRKYIYVANQGTETAPSDTVSKVNLMTKKVESTVKVGKGAHGVVTSPDGKLLYVTNMYASTLSVVDTDKDFVVAELKVGYTPNGVSFKP